MAARTFILLLLCLAIHLSSVQAAQQVQQIIQSQSKETLTIKNKLETAEGRVSDLISRLDSVSDDATRAKNEIHSTLMEVWKIVDLLGRDRCGDVVDKVRVAQKKAETKVTELQDEIRLHLKEIEELKLDLVKRDDSVITLQTEIKTERSRRETLESEARDLRDKLHWASAVSNETQKYELVAERLQALLVVVTERTQLLTRLLTMVGDAQSGFSEWREEISSLTGIVRDAERDFSGGYQDAAVDGLRKHTLELERQLKDALRGKESLADERNSLKKSLDSMQAKISAGASFITGSSGSGRKERIVIQSERTNVVGAATLVIISACTGAIAVYLLGAWQQNRDAPPTQPEKYGFTPTSGRPSPSFHHSPGSPLQYVNNGSASKSLGSRGSTPRRY